MAAEKSTTDGGSAGLSDQDRRLLESWLRDFEQTWNQARLGEWEKMLPPPGDRLRRLALVEMVKIDLRHRWRLGQRARLESYLKVLPELGTPETVAPELIEAEIGVRSEHGATVSPQEYARRFTRQFEGLRPLLEHARARGTAAETVPQSAAAAAAAPAPGLPETAPASRGPAEAGLAETMSFPHGQSAAPVGVKRLGRYQILRRLGQGGMGSVYLAVDTQLDRKVALKLPRFEPEEGSDTLERFYREARAAATIEHPNLCRVYDVGAVDGTHFLSMEFIEGQSLAALIDGGEALTPRQAAVLIRKLALTMQETHEHGVIHRDLKPSNVMINRRGEPVIVDFGLARQCNKAEARLTQWYTVLGTPAYMPPEQIDRTQQDMGPWSDIYSLGVILYWLLAGRTPFQGTMGELILKIVREDPAPPTTYRPDLDPHLASICMKAISRRASDRFPSMAAFAAALDDYLGVASHPPGSPPAAGPSGTTIPTREKPAGGEPSESDVLVQHFARLVTSGTLDKSPSTTSGRPTGRHRRPLRWVGAAAIAVVGVALLIASLGRGIRDRGEPNRAGTAGTGPVTQRKPRERLHETAPPSASNDAAIGGADRATLEKRDRFPVLIGADPAEYRAWLDRMRAAGYRPTFVNSHDTPHGPRFLAIAVANPEKTPWEARLDPTPQAYVKTFDELKRLHELIAVSGHSLAGTTGLASLWIAGQHEWYSSRGDLSTYRERLAQTASRGWVPTFVSGHASGDSYMLATIQVKDDAISALSREDLDIEQFQAALDDARREGDRPVSASAYPVGRSIRFALILARDPRPRAWEERHGVSAAELNRELTRRAPQGWRPDVISGYWQDGASRYLAVWGRDGASEVLVAITASTPAAPAPPAPPQVQTAAAPAEFAIDGRYPVVFGADAAGYQAWLDRMRASGYRPTFVNGHNPGSGPLFAAVAVRNPENLPWEARIHATHAAYDKTLKEGVKDLRPIGVTGYPLGTTTGYASLYFGKYHTGSSRTDHRIDLQQYRKHLVDPDRPGLMPSFLTAYPVKDSYCLDVLFRSDEGVPVRSQEDLDADQLQAALEQAHRQGDRPVAAAAYSVQGATRFALVVARDPQIHKWEERHGISAAELREELERRVSEEFRPLLIVGYPEGGESRYLAVWDQGVATDRTLGTWNVATRPRAARAGSGDWFAIEGRAPVVVAADVATFQAWLDRIRGSGYRPSFVNTHDAGDGLRFTAIATRNHDDSPWEVRLDPATDAFLKTFDDMKSRYALIGIAGYAPDTVTSRVSIWSGHHRSKWYALTGMDLSKYRAQLDSLLSEKLRPSCVSGFAAGSQGFRLDLLAVADGEIPWLARDTLDAGSLQTTLEEGRSRGYRPVCAAAYPEAGAIRFAVVMARDPAVHAWSARPSLTAAQLRRELLTGKARGYLPTILSGYRLGSESRYLAVWIEPVLPELPMTGEPVPELAALDRVMQEFMGARRIRAGTLAVMKDGRLLLERGYGFADRAETRPIAPDAPLRLGAISRVFTAAATRKLIDEGKLRVDARIAGLLGTTPPAGREPDPRWKEITVGHLLDHRSGFDLDKVPDLMFRSREIAAALGKPGPATASDLITYMAGQPMQSRPGQKKGNSSFDDCALGRVIEKTTGLGFLDALRREVLGPLGIRTIGAARSLPGDRDPREPYHADPAMGRNDMAPESRVPVAAPDGTFCLEAVDAAAGLAGSAADVVRLLHAYPNGVEPPTGKPLPAVLFGSLPGTFAVALQRPDGVLVAALFNQRSDESQLEYPPIKDALEKALGGLRKWPAGPVARPAAR
jgi:serine/threonine protein kinase/CubicO group peptidase (beta-lactamase class C family)